MTEQWFQAEAGRPSADADRNGSLPGRGSGVTHPDVAAESPDPHTDAAVTGTVAEVRDERSEFVAELVRAVQTTAGAERARITEEVEARRQGLIEGSIHGMPAKRIGSGCSQPRTGRRSTPGPRPSASGSSSSASGV